MLQSIFSRYREAYSGLPREVWLMAVALFVNRCGSMVMPFLTLFLTRERDMTDAAAGTMIGAWGLGSIVGAYAGGQLASRIGAVRTQIAALFLSAPCYLLVPLGDVWQTIALALFALGAASEAVHPANNAAISLLSSEGNRVRAFALQRLAANLGFTFGPAIGGVLAAVDFRLVFLVDAISTAIGATMLLVFFGFRRLGELEDPAAKKPSVKSPLRDGRFLVFMGLVFLTALVFFQFWSTYPLYLTDHYGFTKPMIGAMFAVNTVIIVIVEMVLIDAVKQWSLLRTIGWGCCLSCLGFGILPWGASLGFALLAITIVTAGEMLSHPLATAYVAQRSPRGSEGAYMGWFSMTFALCAVLGPPGGSLLYGLHRELVWCVSLGIQCVVLRGFYVLARFDAQGSKLDSQPVDNKAEEPLPIPAERVPAAALDD